MRRKIVTLLCLGFGVVTAQPIISSSGIVNAANYAPGIARGSMFIVFGSELGPGQLVQASAYPLSMDLAGTVVTVTAGGQSRAVPLVYTSAKQVAAILPSSMPVGSAQITVTYSGQSSSATQFEIANSRFGVFTNNSRGTSQAVAQNYVSQTSQPRNGFAEAANPGQIVTLWGTGLGPIAGDDSGAPPAGDLNVPLTVMIGDRPARILYKGRSGCCAGIDQIVIEVPVGIEGCYVPIAMQGEAWSSQGTTLAVSSSGRVCTEPGLLTAADLERARQQGGLKIGTLLLANYNFGGTQGVDYGLAGFSRVRYEDLAGTIQRLAAAPSGACDAVRWDSTTGTVIGSIGDFGSGFFDDYLYWYDGAPLDTGERLNLTGMGKSSAFTKVTDGYFLNTFFDYTNPQGQVLLSPGAYTLDNGSGGRDVPAFRANVDIPSPISFSGTDAQSIPRNSDLAVTWTGGTQNERVLIYGLSYSQRGMAGGAFTCVQRGNAGRFVVPSSVLSLLPPSGAMETGEGGGYLMLYSLSPYQRKEVQGLDAFYAASLNLRYQMARFD